MSYQQIPSAVIIAIQKAWPDQAGEIILDLKYDSLNGNYFFTRWGMYIGVEEDGYIHT